MHRGCNNDLLSLCMVNNRAPLGLEVLDMLRSFFPDLMQRRQDGLVCLPPVVGARHESTDLSYEQDLVWVHLRDAWLVTAGT